MSSRWHTSTHPSLYEINTWPWLRGLSAAAGRDLDLGSVPDEHWDAIAERGFDAVWLMGVWERSPAGVRVMIQQWSILHQRVASGKSLLGTWGGDSIPDRDYGRFGSLLGSGRFPVPGRSGRLRAARAARRS